MACRLLSSTPTVANSAPQIRLQCLASYITRVPSWLMIWSEGQWLLDAVLCSTNELHELCNGCAGRNTNTALSVTVDCYQFRD